MALESCATLTGRSSGSRLSALVEELRSFDCIVILDRDGGNLRFEVPDTLTSWIKTGGLKGLLDSFSDVVEWLPNFCEKRQRSLELPTSTVH